MSVTNPSRRKGGMVELTNALNDERIWLAMHLIERIVAAPRASGTYVTMTGSESVTRVTETVDDILRAMEWEKNAK